MADIKPFKAYRPCGEKASTIASLPYDVFNRQEAYEKVQKEPESFLAIDRPETQFEPDHDMYAPEVYKKAHDMLWEKIEKGDFDELKKEYGGLDKDKNTGEVIRTNGLFSDSDVAHRSSVVITKSYDEMKNSENADIADYISERICLHREAFLDKQRAVNILTLTKSKIHIGIYGRYERRDNEQRRERYK